jgi:hypothetical protein
VLDSIVAGLALGGTKYGRASLFLSIAAPLVLGGLLLTWMKLVVAYIYIWMKRVFAYIYIYIYIYIYG